MKYDVEIKDSFPSVIEMNDVPVNCKRIFNAMIYVEVMKFRNNKFHKEKIVTTEVYKEDEEKDNNSFLMKRLRKQLNLKERDNFQILEIEKIKYLGFSIPESIS